MVDLFYRKVLICLVFFSLKQGGERKGFEVSLDVFVLICYFRVFGQLGSKSKRNWNCFAG